MTPAEEKRIVAAVLAGLEPRLSSIEAKITSQHQTVIDMVNAQARRNQALEDLFSIFTNCIGRKSSQLDTNSEGDSTADVEDSHRQATQPSPVPVAVTASASPSVSASAPLQSFTPGVTPGAPNLLDISSRPGRGAGPRADPDNRVATTGLAWAVDNDSPQEEAPSSVPIHVLPPSNRPIDPEPDILVDGKVNKAPTLTLVSTSADQHVWGDVTWFSNLKPVSRKARVPGIGMVFGTAVGTVDLQVRQGPASRPAWTTIRLEDVLFSPKFGHIARRDGVVGIISLPPLVQGGRASVEVEQKVMLTLPSGETVGMSVSAPSGMSNQAALEQDKLRARIRAPRYREGLVRFDNLASYPIFHDKTLFSNLTPCDEEVRQSSSATFRARGKGTVHIQVWSGYTTGWREFTFPEARWCPDYNLRASGPDPPGPDGEQLIRMVAIAGPGQTRALGSVGVQHAFDMDMVTSGRSLWIGENRRYEIGAWTQAGCAFQGRINPPSPPSASRGPGPSSNSSASRRRSPPAPITSSASAASRPPRGGGGQATSASAGRSRSGQSRSSPAAAPTESTQAVIWRSGPSGAHVFNDLSVFDPASVKWEEKDLGDHCKAKAHGKVTFRIRTPERGWFTFTLKKAYYVPAWRMPIQSYDRRYLPQSSRETHFVGRISAQVLCEPADAPFRYVSLTPDQEPLQLTLSNDLQFDEEITVATFGNHDFVADARFLYPS